MSFKNNAKPGNGNNTEDESLPTSYSMQSEMQENDGCKVLTEEADANATECCACTENLYQVAFPMNDENDFGERRSTHTDQGMDQIELTEEAGIYVVSSNAITNTKPDPKAALMADHVERSDYVKQQSKKKSRKKDRREMKRGNKQKDTSSRKKNAYDVRSILRTSDDQKSTGTSSSSGSEASFAATDEKVNILRKKRKDREDRVCTLALVWMAGLTTVAALVITGTLLGLGLFRDGDPASRTPSSMPSLSPSVSPTAVPTTSPSLSPSSSPSLTPSISPSTSPSSSPSSMPSTFPTNGPTFIPTFRPTATPSSNPSASPSLSPSSTPSFRPSLRPSVNPTSNPSSSPSMNPTSNPSMNPSSSPTETRGAILFGVGEDPFRRNSAADRVSTNFNWKKLVVAVAIWGLF